MNIVSLQREAAGMALWWSLTVLAALFSISYAQVQCTVGSSGTYATINAGLNGCNGGVGSIKLLLDGVFAETMIVPVTVTNLTLTSVEFEAGIVPAHPFPTNITTRITGSSHIVTNVSTAIFMQGLIIDGASTSSPMFAPWLINNNFTMDRCLVANWTGDYSIRIEPCQRAVSINFLNNRFYRVWGTTVWAEGHEDIIFINNILDKVGGYHNQSGVYLKMSYVTEGIWHVSNNSGWLIFDAQPPSCIFLGDTNGMTRCNRGIQECYNVFETELRRPNCVMQNISYVDENTNSTLFIMDYPQDCRIYTPCVCQDLVFIDTNTSATVILAIGDIFFYTGLRLNCTAIEDDDPLVVLTGETNVTDPDTNITTTVPNSDIFVYQRSNAGDGGIGQPPPVTDPDPQGFSLYPNVYTRGVIDPEALNCTCPIGINSSMAALGFDCNYLVIPNDTYCMNGRVRTCHLEFLTCYPASESLLTILSVDGFIGNDTLLDLYCLANGTFSLVNETEGQAPCNPIVSFNASLEWTLWRVGSFACIGTFPVGTAFEVISPGLTNASATSLCGTDTQLIEQGCPPLPGDPGPAEIISACDTCSDTFNVSSEVVLVRVCRPYTCPMTWNVTCVYTYDAGDSVVITHVMTNTTDYDDGREWDNVTNVWTTGEELCPSVDPEEAAYQTIQCQQQILHGQACAPSPGVLTVFNATVIGGEFPHNETAYCGAPYQCIAPNMTTCSCDIQQTGPCLAEYEVGNASAMFHFDNINDGLSFMDSTFNRAQQLYFGAIIDRTSQAVIMNNSIFVPKYSDWQSVLREWHLQNYQVEGAIHDMAYGLFDAQSNIRSYQTFCDDDCMMEFTSEEDFDCVVDASITVDAEDGVYQLIQDAIDDDCENIILKNYENFYAENIVFNNKFKRLYSPDGACILGNQHKLEKDTIDFRGVCFLHPGDESKPLFIPSGGMDQLWIRNCILEGQGVKGAGILPFNMKNKIKDLVINNTEISSWNFAVAILRSVDSFVMTHNYIHDSYGRLFEVRYENVFRVHSNSFVNCRGTGSTKGASLVRMVARTLGDYGKQQNDQDRSCSDKREKKYGNNCAFYANVQNTDVTEDDVTDVCWSILGGAITIEDIFDNVCVKAATGFQLRQLDVIIAASVSPLLARNSMIRPSNFITTGKKSNIKDWAYDQFFTKKEKPSIFSPYQKRSCNFPCDLDAVKFPVCTVNPNFYYGYVGVPGEIYSVYGQTDLSSFGFGVYANFSQALMFCDIIRVNPFTGGVERPIYCVGNKGGRMFRDVFAVNKTGVTFYGALLPDEPNICPECFHRCEVFGDGWLILAENFTSANMSYTRDNRAMDQVTHMFATLPNLQPVWNLNFTNNTISGGNLEPYTESYAFRFIFDMDPDTEYANSKKRGGRKLPKLNKQPNSRAIIEYNVFKDFAGYNPNGLIDQDTKEAYNTTIQEYPFSDPIYLEFQNDNPNKSEVWIRENVFYNVDDRAIDSRGAAFQNISNNRFINLGSRSFGNPTGILITGSPTSGSVSNPADGGSIHPSFVYFLNNEINQTRPILNDKTASRAQPGRYSHVWFNGFNAQSYICVENNTIDGGAIAIRWSGMTKQTVTNCVNSTEVPGFFDDDVDFLRRIWYLNPNADGYVHDLVYADPYQDFFQTWLFCDDGCPGVMDACNVSLTNPFYTPIHPYWNTQVFTDLSLAITNCTHPSRRIRVMYNKPSAPYTLSGPIVFPPGHPALDPSLNITDVFGEENATATEKVELRLCGQQVLNGIIKIRNFKIVHSCGSTSSTLDLNVPDPGSDPLRLQILDNDFIGGGTTAYAINGTADDGLVVGDIGEGSGKQVFFKALQTSGAPADGYGNTFTGYAGNRIVNLYGRNCSSQIIVRMNTWNTCPGNCIYVDEVGGIDFDLNTINNGLATINTEAAASYISVCQPTGNVPYHLYAHDNYITNGSSYSPNITSGAPSGGYITGFWFDPVPTPHMKVEILRTKGYFPGACLREDNKPVQYPFGDRQLPARKISQKDFNINCQGGWHDIRLNQQPSFDFTIDTNPSYYKQYICDNGCPHTTDIQLAIIVGIISGIISLVFVAIMMYCVCQGPRLRYMWSGVAGEMISTNTGRLYSQGTISRLAMRTKEEVEADFDATMAKNV